MSTKKENEQVTEQPKVTAVTVNKAESKNTKVAPVQQLIYVGPTIKGIVVENTVFRNGLPEELKKKMEEVPAMKSLLVGVDNLAKVKAAMNRESSAESLCYKKILESMEKGE